MEKNDVAITSSGVHPNEVARLFGVHIRTPFRWISDGRLNVDEEGRALQEEVAAALGDWRRTCSLWEARVRLGVSPGTIRAWRGKGILETVLVMGFERVTLESVECLARRSEKRVFTVRSGFVRQCRLLQVLGIGCPSLHDLLNRGVIPSVIEGGVQLISAADAKAIEAAWRSSCPPAAAQRILGVSRFVLQARIRAGRVSLIEVIERSRVALAGLAKTPEERARLRAYLAKEAEKLARRCPEQKIERQFSSLKPVQVRGEGRRRLTTCEEVAKAAGKPESFVESQFRTGNLRGVEKSGKVFVYISSAELLLERVKNGTK